MKMIYIWITALCLFLIFAGESKAQELDSQVDYRIGASVTRDEQGRIVRSAAVLRAFKAEWPCPSTGSRVGACPGWSIDHVIPLACGGKDAVYNLQWLPDEAKSASTEIAKDRFERKVYGGRGASKGCP